MKNLSKVLAVLLFGGLAFLFLNLMNNKANSMAKPALKFIESLSPDQKSKAVFEFDNQSRFIWSYLPVSMVRRAGISLRQLYEPQKVLVHELLKSSLSQSGYMKTEQIIGLEDILKVLEPNNYGRDADQYHISIYGTPDESGNWAWNFQGHHLFLSFTIVGGKVSASPTFLGANPAEVRSGPQKGLRVLKNEEDLGFQLINSMNDKQKAKAIIQANSYWEILTTTSTQVGPLVSEGISVTALNTDQKQLLFDLIDEYISVMPADLAKKRQDKLEKAGKDKILFAWAGATKPGVGHYYRVQGPTFLIEFDNTQNKANHIHSVWRDFNGDFGRDLIREHYQHSGHH